MNCLCTEKRTCTYYNFVNCFFILFYCIFFNKCNDLFFYSQIQGNFDFVNRIMVIAQSMKTFSLATESDTINIVKNKHLDNGQNCFFCVFCFFHLLITCHLVCLRDAQFRARFISGAHQIDYILAGKRF